MRSKRSPNENLSLVVMNSMFEVTYYVLAALLDDFEAGKMPLSRKASCAGRSDLGVKTEARKGSEPITVY